jgi:hypothetical protein
MGRGEWVGVRRNGMKEMKREWRSEGEKGKGKEEAEEGSRVMTDDQIRIEMEIEIELICEKSSSRGCAWRYGGVRWEWRGKIVGDWRNGFGG